MNTNDLYRLRSKILENISELEDTASSARTELRESSKCIPNFLQDESDAAKGELDLENTLRVYCHAVFRQGQLLGALVNIDSGVYGTCLECGEEICLQRLESVPSACLCVTCQEAREVGSRMFAIKSYDLQMRGVA